MASSSSTEGLSDVLQYDMNIILVDDEPIARKVLTRSLQKCGYKSLYFCIFGNFFSLFVDLMYFF